jgi:hypothetical protein
MFEQIFYTIASTLQILIVILIIKNQCTIDIIPHITSLSILLYYISYFISSNSSAFYFSIGIIFQLKYTMYLIKIPYEQYDMHIIMILVIISMVSYCVSLNYKSHKNTSYETIQV